MRFFLFLLLVSCFLQAKEFNFSIIHTNDLHSYFYGTGPDYYWSPNQNDDDVLGHYARLATLIKKLKSEERDHVYLVDGGDFYSGSLFHLVGPNKKFSSSPELEFFHYLNYDAITLGNHEFDAYDDGLFTMLEKMKQRIPIITTNLKFNSESKLKKYFSFSKKDLSVDHLHSEYITRKNQNYSISFLGVVGPDAAKVSLPVRSEISFYGYNDESASADWDELYKRLTETIKHIKKKDSSEIIVLSLHGGLSEAKKILDNVKGINVIIAGHTHKLYERPYEYKGAFIAQAGSYGRYVGKLKFNYSGGKLTLTNKKTFYEVNDSIAPDQYMLEKIEKYKSEVNQVLGPLKHKFDEKIFELTSSKLKSKKGRENLGVFCTTKILSELKKYDSLVDVYFTSNGLIRKNLELYRGKTTIIQLSDIFNLFAIGMNKDYVPGSPMVTFYLKKKDFKKVVEFLEGYAIFNPKFSPAFPENVQYEIRSWGIPFINRIKNLKVNGKELDKLPEQLKISTNSFVAGFFDKVSKMSWGLINIKGYDMMGKEISRPEVTEYREFDLLAKALKSN